MADGFDLSRLTEGERAELDSLLASLGPWVPQAGPQRAAYESEADIIGYLMGWVRTTDAGQRCQTLMTFNPPTSAEGQWVLRYFGPWLERNHPNPAKPGELRWYATVDGVDVACASGDPFDHNGERVFPQSRTFIHARVTDNAFLRETGYVSTLQGMPEPLRSQMLHGDFTAGMEDDSYQVIPSLWVEMAQARWVPRDVKGTQDSLGEASKNLDDFRCL